METNPSHPVYTVCLPARDTPGYTLMKKLTGSLLIVGSAVGWMLLASCEDVPYVPDDTCRGDFCPTYEPLTAPENLLDNLQESYKRREIQHYAELLAPEFRFYFQPLDAATHGEYWNRDQDSTGTDAFFRTNLVSTILIELVYGPSEVPTEAGFDPDVRKIRINQVQLEVDQTDGTTLLVTDLQDMYFRPGRAAAGEDTTRWYLLEWRDLPSAGAPKPRTTRSTTWGSVKARYR